jgi:hypothetical protein
VYDKVEVRSTWAVPIPIGTATERDLRRVL